MKTHSTIVIGFNKEQEVAFFKTFDIDSQRDEALKTYNWCRTEFSGTVITEKENLQNLFENL
ncbi:hypothetical protein SAMN04489761_3039 [Tenacibaculum sp. MAR_2009_124]|uniref:hypothetical protein n=1 Tax=Tenacibaculum sp. MAR_2009_124 TaxID=1250059 RepID=UPI00089ABFA1|nr:hypothetical protein [Tenacibaculum sp. MAR_2009_124]SEC45492.1 hypothetical protein SAMN04489761_3039 [Tenacibaculum sp. MAR_2009_124]